MSLPYHLKCLCVGMQVRLCDWPCSSICSFIRTVCTPLFPPSPPPLPSHPLSSFLSPLLPSPLSSLTPLSLPSLPSPLSSPPLPFPLPSLHSAQPVIRATTPLYAENGKTAHLSCSVNTSATLRWIFVNSTVIPSRGRYSIVVTETGRNITLAIDTVMAQDAGEYVCRAGNSVGSDQTTVVLQSE